jgi:hypothetical protein
VHHLFHLRQWKWSIGLEFGDNVQYKLHDTNTGLDNTSIANECRRQLYLVGLFLPVLRKYAL